MCEQIGSDLNIQSVMIVWDLNLTIEGKAQVDIFTPLFSLSSTEEESKNWIRLDRLNDNITISSNFESIEELQQCKTYMINSSTNKIEDEYEGFKTFKYKHNGWIEKVRFVFELKMQYTSPADPPIIWKHCTTEMKSPINTYGKSLSLETEEITRHRVLNTQGVACVVEWNGSGDTSYRCGFSILPEEPSESWNLFTVMLRKENNNVLGWYYLHLISQAGWSGKLFSRFEPLIILEINELSTSLKNMSEYEIDAVKCVINPSLIPTNDQELNEASSYLMEYLINNNLSEITVQVGDQKIRLHKEALATSADDKKELPEPNTSAKLMEKSTDKSKLRRNPSKLNKIRRIFSSKKHV